MMLVSTAITTALCFRFDPRAHFFDRLGWAVIRKGPKHIFVPRDWKYRCSTEQHTVGGVLNDETGPHAPLPVLSNGFRQDDLTFGGDHRCRVCHQTLLVRHL